jgi:putative transposase
VIDRYGIPETFNTDQGCQFTSAEFILRLLSRGVKISMDDRGLSLDNVSFERLWRTVEYDEVHLKGYSSQIEAFIKLEE